MDKETIEAYIVDTLQTLKVFTYDEFQECLQDIPDSNYKSEYIQSIFDGASIHQVFEYYIYIM